MNSPVASKKEQSHERIVEAASRTMRRAGFNGVSVAQVMKDAGLTHGGFYAHFASRDALLAEAVIHASLESGARITSHIESVSRKNPDKFRAFIEAYLSDGQISDCENGCPVGSLCGEMRSQAPQVLDSSRQVIDRLHKLISQVMPAGYRADAPWAVASALIGALQLARAIGDNRQGRAILAAAKADLLERYKD